MKKTTDALFLSVMIAGAFLAGFWYAKRASGTAATAGAGEILHGPVAYAAAISRTPGGGQAATEISSSDMAPGTVKISSEKQQLIGVRTGVVEKVSDTHTLRLLGRVAPDETRVYKVNAGTEGSIRDVAAVTTGSQVKKDELLATFSAPNAASVIQLYIINSGAAQDARRAPAGSVEAQAVPLAAANIRQRVDQLQNLGMSAAQMAEVRRTREVPESIKIVAPADGFVLARNVSPGQKFDRGVEWFRIADLNRVWILADVFENEAQYFQPGLLAQVSLPGQQKTLAATVSEVLPQFDAATRTLKVRLEADNPGYLLRPDMFVNVELPVTLTPTIAVPVDAVVDSGLKKTVFIERTEGFFEPRRVKTGWRFGERVEIIDGLAPGERIAVSGTFLLDSESRMKLAAARVDASGQSGEPHGAHDHGAHSHAGHGP